MSPPTAFFNTLSVWQCSDCCWRKTSGISDGFPWSYTEESESLKPPNEIRTRHGKHVSHFHPLLLLPVVGECLIMVPCFTWYLQLKWDGEAAHWRDRTWLLFVGKVPQKSIQKNKSSLSLLELASKRKIPSHRKFCFFWTFLHPEWGWKVKTDFLQGKGFPEKFSFRRTKLEGCHQLHFLPGGQPGIHSFNCLDGKRAFFQ